MKTKKIIGIVVLLNIIPILGILFYAERDGYIAAYISGCIITGIILVIIGLCFFLNWCFDI